MNIPDSVTYALMVGGVSAAGAAIGAWLTSRSTLKATQKALAGVERQIEFQHAVRIAEFRQAWINDLRNSMVILQSMGVTPDVDHQRRTEFYDAGTRVELLMNRSDPRYTVLRDCMYAFLAAETMEAKYLCNAPFIEVCQEVLKTEWEVLKKDLAKAGTSATPVRR